MRALSVCVCVGEVRVPPARNHTGARPRASREPQRPHRRDVIRVQFLKFYTAKKIFILLSILVLFSSTNI